MKILMVHNQYRQTGGEDKVFELESELLESRGHKVHKLVARSLIDNITFRSRLGENARILCEREYTPEKNYSQLIGLYEELADGVKLGQ